MSNRSQYILSGGIALSLTILLAAWAGWQQTSLASHLVRLHVVANSDSVEDQTLKLQVRDAVLEHCGKVLPQEGESSQAVEALLAVLPELAETGAKVVAGEGYRYPVRVRMEYEAFPETEYEGFSLPAGTYRALRVEIGDASGQNWWCVVFPSLCMAEAEELSETAMAAGLTEEEVDLITQSGEKAVIRFRCVEIWEELLQRMKNRNQK